MDFFDQLQHQTSEREYLLGAPIIHSPRSPAPRPARSTSPSSPGLPPRQAHGAAVDGLRPLPERLEWLREAIAEYIEEEIGHQEWILNDIRACGGDAERCAMASRRCPPS